MTTHAPVQPQGLFHRVATAHAGVLATAQRELQETATPAALRPWLARLGEAPPARLSLIFLAAAEASGGVRPTHVAALPTISLAMEALAVSAQGQPGEASAALTGALLMLLAGRARGCPAEVVEATNRCLLQVFSLGLEARPHGPPESQPLQAGLERRHAVARASASYVLDGALALNGHPPVPAAALDALAALLCDVDDVAALLAGERDALQRGVVTRPLLHALALRPALLAEVAKLWQADEASAAAEQLHAQTVALGVPATVRGILDAAQRCVHESPAPLRPFMRALTREVCEALRGHGPELERTLAEGLGPESPEQAAPELARRGPRAICVYCSSSDAVAPVYFEAATALGAALGERGRTLVFGGSNTGLMGALARSTHAHGGRVLGVILEIMRGTPYVFDGAHEQISTRDLRTRKSAMDARADAFVVLPGGFGTLDETLEILAAKQMHMHHKPIVFFNVGDFWRPLMHLFDHMFQQRFASGQHHQQLYHLADSVEAVLAYLDAYEPPPFPVKWF